MKADDGKNKKNLQKLNERGLKRIEIKMIRQILTILYEEGPLKKTPLASKSGLNSRRSTLYLDWLSLLDLVDVESSDDHQLFSISGKGRDLYLQKLCN